MTDRFVTVPDSLELPAAVKVPVARLVGPTGAAATPADLGAATAAERRGGLFRCICGFHAITVPLIFALTLAKIFAVLAVIANIRDTGDRSRQHQGDRRRPGQSQSRAHRPFPHQCEGRLAPSVSPTPAPAT